MPSPLFSLTVDLIIDPVLILRESSPGSAEGTPTVLDHLWCFTKAELATRVMALFTSVVAVADVGTHLGTAVYKGGYIGVGFLIKHTFVHYFFTLSPVTWDLDEIGLHGYNTAVFSLIVLVGSVAGFIWPGVFQYFPHTDGLLSPDSDVEQQMPVELSRLAQEVSRDGEVSPYNRLQAFWRDGPLAHKHWFVKIFSNDLPKFKAVRKALETMVYRPIGTDAKDASFKLSRLLSANHQVRWLSSSEVAEGVNGGLSRTNAYSQAFFFYATHRGALESILKSKQIGRGEFVSTRPELSCGPCILAFKRVIERLSPLVQGFTRNEKAYWVSFGNAIPVNENTLAYIILSSNSEAERLDLETRSKQWTGKKINVILYGDVQDKLRRIERLKMGIPIEWPEETKEQADLIFTRLQRAALTERAAAVGL